MESLIKKFKNLVNEENKMRNEENEEEDSEENQNNNENDFIESQKNFKFESSIMNLKKSSSNKSNKFSQSFNGNNNQINSLNKLKSSSSSSKIDKEESNDQILFLINKTLKYIQSHKNSLNAEIIEENLNNIYDAYINSISNQRINSSKNIDKDLIMQTKYETAQKMFKNFELKYLTSEKEKNKLNEQYNILLEKYNRLKDRNELNVQRGEDKIKLEKNNSILIEVNEDVKKKMNEMNLKNDFVKKKYDEEIENIKNLLKEYKQKLEQIENKVYNRENSDRNQQINKNNLDKTLTLNSL